MVVEDRFLSRRHTRLSRAGDGWRAEDLGSHNGTRLNGEPLLEPALLRPGDELQLSSTRIVLRPALREAPGEETLREGPVPDGALYRAADELLESHSSVEIGALDDPAELRHFAQRLRLLNEVHQALAGPIGLDELLALILDRAFDHLRPEEGVIILRQGEAGDRVAASRSAAGSGPAGAKEGEEPPAYSRTVLRYVLEEGKAALLQDVALDERFAEAESILAAGARSVLAAPLLDDEGTLGMIALTSRAAADHFREEDLDLLVSLAAVAALRVRNLMLAEEAAERRRLEEELLLARSIQVSLLPAGLPTIPDWELSGGNLPSRGVSGDLYLVEELRGGEEWLLLVADVSGKGMAAALLAASLEALTAGTLEVGLGPHEICAKVARQLYRRTPSAKYATAFVAILAAADGTLRYANAGHNPALVVRAGGEVERLAATGQPLGLLAEGEYRLAEVSVHPGDTLALYTDGITEAVDPADEEYGLERLATVLGAGRETPLERLRHAVEEDLERFAQGVQVADDRTLVLLRRS